MRHYAVASHFEESRHFFSGGFVVGNADRGVFVPTTSDDAKDAFVVIDRRAAEAVATGLTELCGALPPFDARTWFVVELPEAA